MNLSQMQNWMDSGNYLPCYLIEVQVNKGGAETTLYLSDVGFVTGPQEEPTNTPYVPAIQEIGVITERMSVNGQASVGQGSITLANLDGALDEFMGFVWDNRPIRILMGDVSWPRADFFTVFSGATEGLNVRSQDSLELQVRDRLNLLNGAVSETLTEDGRTVPCSFGEVSNVPALLVNPATLTYQVHVGSVQSIAEVRDNGVPVAFFAMPETGQFQLSASPIGDVTAVVLGDNSLGYGHTCTDLVTTLITGYGPKDGRVNPQEIDDLNFSEFALAHPECVGTYLSGRENLLSTLSYITSSVNASLVVSKTGMFRLVALNPPEQASKTVATIGPADIHDNSFKPLSREPVSPAVKLAFNRNYLPLGVVAGGIPDAHKTALQEEWKYVRKIDQAALDLYRLNAEPEAKQTALQVQLEAEAVADNMLVMFGVQRYIYTFRCYSWLLTLQIGDVISLRYPRFGFDNGKNALIVGTKTAWSRGYIDLEVLV